VNTEIAIWNDYEKSKRLLLGEVMLMPRDGHHHKGIWSLGAYLLNATDFEHDAAWLLKMELVGVELDSMTYGQTCIQGWIRADHSEAFRVPSAGYNPVKHKDATPCREKDCRRGEKHIIVPEGFYVPPENPELFNIVRGRRIEITMTSK
jgi:hypothetical protein